MKRQLVSALLLALHLAAVAWVACCFERRGTSWWFLVVSALPLAQVSLLAIWGAWSRWPVCIRLSGVALGVTALWAVECRMLFFDGLRGNRSAAYAVAFAVQTLCIVIVLITTRSLHSWLVGRRDTKRQKWRVQFAVMSLLGTVAAVALVLGVWRGVYHARVSPVLCRSEQMLVAVADRVGSQLYAEQNRRFLQKHYDPAYPIHSLLEDAATGCEACDGFDNGRNQATYLDSTSSELIS